MSSKSWEQLNNPVQGGLTFKRSFAKMSCGLDTNLLY